MDIQPPLSLKKPLNIPKKVLMSPGPTNNPKEIMEALRKPILGHMHPEIFEIMSEVKDGIRYIFQTQNQLTLALSASGHGGMEAIFCNLLEPGDIALIAVNGIWGERASGMAKRCGAKVVTVNTEPGKAFSLPQLEWAISQEKPQLLFIVQGESSTGVYQELEGLGEICQKYNCLLAVDTVASLGGVAFYADRWGIDAVYTTSQKALGALPGITPISFSQRALNRILTRKTPIQSYYFDMKLLGTYWGCFSEAPIYHHTLSPHLLYALRQALVLFCEETLEKVIERHQECHRQLMVGLRKLGLKFFVNESNQRLPTVTAIRVPSSVEWQDVAKFAMKKYKVEISGGLGPTVGKIFRIGLLGPNATPQKVDLMLTVLKDSLNVAHRLKKSKL